MGRVIKTWRDPYDEGFYTCRKKEVEFQTGLTILVGCNGAGKSTMLHNIKDELKKENIPTFFFDNQEDGGSNSRSESLWYGDVEFAAISMSSSEGENIALNLGKCASKWRKFLLNGDNGNRYNRLVEALFAKNEGKNDEKEAKIANERWILLDAMDSGYSIDNVIEMKDLFDLVINDAKRLNIDLYIVVSSNEYELAHNSNCMDVTEGNYVTFSDYNEYKKFIIHTRKKKDKRYK